VTTAHNGGGILEPHPLGEEPRRSDLIRANARESNARHVQRFLRWQRDVKRSTDLTVYQYGACLRTYLVALDGTPLEAARMAQIEVWLLRPRRGGRQPAAATVARNVAVLRSLYRYLQASGRIDQNPTLLLIAPAVRNRQPKAISDQTWTKVWRSDLSDAERVFLGLGFYCGLRRAEIAALRPSHLVEGRIAYFMRKGQTDDVLDYAATTRLFAERLPQLLAEPSEFLDPLDRLASTRAGRDFLLPWGEEAEIRSGGGHRRSVPAGMTAPHQLNKRLGGLLKRIGLADPFTPHALRHSFVTNLLRVGVPLYLVTELADHANPKTTMRYARVGRSALADWATSTAL
jgi:integrase/recombinase XerC